jgi:hypothetical protein
MYTKEFVKNMDRKRKTNGPADPDAQLEIDEEYFESHKGGPKGGKTAKIRPEGRLETGERNYDDSGYGYSEQPDFTSSPYQSSMKKLTTQGDMFDTEDGLSPEATQNFTYGKEHLEKTLN